MNRHTLTVAIAVTATALAGLLAAPAASASAAQPSQHLPVASTATPTYQGIAGTITATGTVGLVFGGGDWHTDHLVAPTSIPNGGKTTFSMGQDHSSSWVEDGAYGTAKARIYDHGKPTEFWVKMYSSVYVYPYDKADCTIFRGDPDVLGQAIDFSPYTCSVTSVAHSDPWQVSFTVSPTDAIKVTGQGTQHSLLTQACEGANAEANCFYTPTSVTYLQDKPQPYGDAVVNPYDDKMTMTVESEHKYATSDSVGIGYDSTLKVWGIWSNSLSINYEHTWTDTRTFKQSEDVEVAPHTRYWFTIAATLDQITGDFLVRANGRVYSIQNATVVMPDATQGATIVGHKGPATGKSLGRHAF